MKKIQTKIMLMVIAATLGVSIINTLQSVSTTRRSTISAIEKTLTEVTELAAAAAQNMISTYTLTIAEMASNPVLYDEETSLEQKQAFIQAKVEQYGMRFGGMTDETGYDAVHNVDISGHAFFQEAVKGNSYISSPFITGDDMFLMVSAPVKEGDAIHGVLYFQCDNYILQSIVEEIQIGEEGESYILNKEGVTIACGDEQAVWDQENIAQEAARSNDQDLQALAEVEKKMTAGESGIAHYSYEKDHSKNIQGYTPIPGTDGWSAAVTIDENEFMHNAYVESGRQVLTAILLCMLVILAAMVLSRSIARPIVRCADRLRALSKGDLKSPVPQVRSRDEVHVLSTSIAVLIENFKAIVEEVGTVLGAIAGGDLTKEAVQAEYPGDFRDLQNYLRIINEKLNSTLSDIVNASFQVSKNAGQMASSSGVLSQGATEQARAVEQLCVTMSEIKHDAEKTDTYVREVKTAVDCVGEQLQQSGEYIGHLNQAMNMIMSSTSEIGHIIDTIEDIALQTNILALNASVEASRAGEAGKGFAVVAEAVRELAVKSDMEAKATIELIMSSAKAVSSGNEVVASVTASVTDIVAKSVQIAEHMNTVSQAVQNQTGAIEQVSEAIGQISNVVQSNTTSAEQSAVNSRGLSEQAAVLQRLTSSFSLRG